MRLRLAFKLHGEEADLARQIADVSGISADRIAKLAMQRYMRDVLERAQSLSNQLPKEETDGQPSATDIVHPAGTVSDVPDPVPSQEA